ncbi:MULTISPECIES: hypothetical protein [unclassified Bradyrhizobium]|uniref:hypothetical protein n=1 Tax=unclassified Bradyrhizobium TaxID=2631580 RepID=UPI001BAD9933|nr:MULTISPECIES: hypothetical protein [unclassified Bradyrhizobium]MBR1227213.1 hypothetical protein [Bradyrhizobium sp. AUGA SZCCT0176]MBR1232936.1 hypothetical protein [Bradyrhizobium sp. AUGA SZCCT0182]MBR1298655.1 hypothetical protein [Bradyrhizobium sp. AUGA SZCCT0042]
MEEAVAADGAAAVVVVSIAAVAGVVDMAVAEAMASTVFPWFVADRVAGGMPTAFASAGIIDTGLIGEIYATV